jgi:enoyl-[acyl-carrier protein] reductase I
VGDASRLDALFDALGRTWGSLDFVVHAIGFSDKNELARPLCRHQPREFRDDDGHLGLFLHRRLPARRKDDAEWRQLLTLTYYGAEKVMPHYNVMGVAKAALEASGDVPGRGPGPRRHPRERDLAPARSRRWRPRASAISATS